MLPSLLLTLPAWSSSKQITISWAWYLKWNESVLSDFITWNDCYVLRNPSITSEHLILSHLSTGKMYNVHNYLSTISCHVTSEQCLDTRWLANKKMLRVLTTLLILPGLSLAQLVCNEPGICSDGAVSEGAEFVPTESLCIEDCNSRVRQSYNFMAYPFTVQWTMTGHQ